VSRRVVVTAGAAGIGRAIADRFRADGDRVAVCDADAEAVAAFAADRPDALAETADVTSEADMARFLGRVEAAWGGADILCANAGTGGPAGGIETLGLDDWRACLSVNLDGAFLACRWAARAMTAQGAGLIVLTSSTAGLGGYPLRSPYATAKWGVIGLMKTLAMELGPRGIRVNAICPGAVEGPRMDRVVANEARARGVSEAEVRAGYVRAVSMRTWVTAEDVAGTIHFLASPAGARISGQALAVDGHTETNASC
jgi:NAD(P)-dependent dehydrogenase (short-subunit alcohol dehydrogenase family)